MDTVTVALQVLLALGLVNVWILRFRKPSAWRGAAAPDMRAEFAAYGLPPWFVGVVGTLKLACAAGLLIGLWVPALVVPAAGLLAALMLGAVLMHVKISDPVRRSLPAFLMLAGCVTLLTR